MSAATAAPNYMQSVGRRKEAVARVTLKPGTGVITINGMPSDKFLQRATLEMIIRQPFEVTNTQNKYDAACTVNGGGLTGQAGAVRLGISRGLVKFNERYRAPLRRAGFLTRDPRMVERKKYGLHKARKRPQFSKR